VKKSRIANRLFKVGVAGDGADSSAAVLDLPDAGISIGEGLAFVATPEDAENTAVLAVDLAAVCGVDSDAEDELDGVVPNTAADFNRGSLAFNELVPLDRLHGVAEGNSDLFGVVILHEGRVANDFADFAALFIAESPQAGTTVGEGDVGVLAAEDDDGLVLIVEDLASEILLLDGGAELEKDGLERAFLVRAGLGAATFEEGDGGLGLSVESDGDGLVSLLAVAGSSHGAGGGEKGKEGSSVLHFEIIWVFSN